MEMRAGLRWLVGKERIRSRRALPKVQAVVVVNEVNVCSGLVSWAIRTWGYGIEVY